MTMKGLSCPPCRLSQGHCAVKQEPDMGQETRRVHTYFLLKLCDSQLHCCLRSMKWTLRPLSQETLGLLALGYPCLSPLLPLHTPILGALKLLQSSHVTDGSLKPREAKQSVRGHAASVRWAGVRSAPSGPVAFAIFH